MALPLECNQMKINKIDWWEETSLKTKISPQGINSYLVNYCPISMLKY